MKIILGSNSPRRVSLLAQMGYTFEQRIGEIEEQINPTLPYHEIPESIAIQKFQNLSPGLSDNELLICADTLVFFNDQILSKPRNIEDAKKMLRQLSGENHTVITGVCIGGKSGFTVFSDQTFISFGELTDQQIEYYIREYSVIDKAGAYGIQDWIGLIGIRRIEGSYTNVMGLPTHKLFSQIQKTMTI